MALVVWGRRSRMVAQPAFEPRWQRLNGGQGLHRIGQRGAVARAVAATVLTAALASGAGWQTAQRFTWYDVAGALPDTAAVGQWIATWEPSQMVGEHPHVALLERADPMPAPVPSDASVAAYGTDYLTVWDLAAPAPQVERTALAASDPITQPAPTAQVTPLPAVAAVAQSAPAPLVTPVAARAQPTTHVVASGETLSAIAGQYDVSVADIVKLNKLADPDKLAVGDRLQIAR